MRPLEERLRQRIDDLSDDNERLRRELMRLRATFEAMHQTVPHAIYGVTAELARRRLMYLSEEARVEARRRTWRESKRRARARAQEAA